MFGYLVVGDVCVFGCLVVFDYVVVLVCVCGLVCLVVVLLDCLGCQVVLSLFVCCLLLFSCLVVWLFG